MSEDNNNNTTNSLLTGAMFLIFMALKLTGHITWSWLWVSAPLWVPFCIAVVLFVFVGVCFAGAKVLDRCRFPKAGE